ncbi:MAG TPA: MBL fold metallo-hydrolase, partial [Hellea balneolensis]|nr:MBL fold metallo-hydrolase [Hellea balneolensis]
MSTPEPAMRFFSDTTPKPGDVTEVRPGVFWLRMALPMAGLDHINLYFLKDGDGFTVIDTGLGWHEAKQVWNQVFEKQMNGAQVKKVICTHLHPDHAGLAGWVCRKFDAPLLMSRAEYFLCRVLAADTGKPAPREGIRFYKRAGLNDEQIENYRSRF